MITVSQLNKINKKNKPEYWKWDILLNINSIFQSSLSRPGIHCDDGDLMEGPGDSVVVFAWWPAYSIL